MRHGIPSKKGYEINYKRYFLASKIGNKSIINNIMGVFKIMVKSIINSLENVLIWVGYNWVGYKVDIIALEKEIKELKKDVKLLMNIINKDDDEDYSYESELKKKQKDNIDFCLCYIDIDNLVEDVYNVCNYGNFINKNELKETITKHINLNN